MLRVLAPHLQQATPAAEGIYGGRLRVATTGQPAGLDGHFVAQRTIGLIGWNMFEALFTFDADYDTVPMLAEGIEVSDDGLTNKITLRQGVPFHNGDEMRAADVVASFNRWAPVSSLGLAISDVPRRNRRGRSIHRRVQADSPARGACPACWRASSRALDPSRNRSWRPRRRNR